MQVAWTFCGPSPRTGLCHAAITPEESQDIEVGKKGQSTKAISQTAANKKGSKAAGRGKTGQSPKGAVHTDEACKEGNAKIAQQQQQQSSKARGSKKGSKPAQKGTSGSSPEAEAQAAANPDAVAAQSGEQQGSKHISKAGAVKKRSKAGVQGKPQISLVKAASARGKNKIEGGVLNKVTKPATRCSKLRTARGSENICLAANSP
jgi:hypothetical protein